MPVFISFFFQLQGGLHVIGLLDAHVAIACVPVVCGLELIAAVYTYGSKKLSLDVQFMTGKPLLPIWLFLWKYLIPVLLLVRNQYLFYIYLINTINI